VGCAGETGARRAAMQKLRIVTDFGWEIAHSHGRFATPVDFPLHDGTSCRGLHARRWGLGFVHRSRTILCRRAKPLVTFR
jgi:hypothetical protein